MLQFGVPVNCAWMVVDWPALMVVLALVICAVGPMATFFESEPFPQDAVTLTLKVSVPDALAVKWMLSVPAPEVIIPLVIVHWYVAPLTAVMDAVFPVEDGQTSPATLMEG